MWDINGRLDPERAKVANDLLRRQASKIAGDRPVTSNDMAAAFFDLLADTDPDTDPANNRRGSSEGGRVGGAGVGGEGVGPAPRMRIGYIVDAATIFPVWGTHDQWQPRGGVRDAEPPGAGPRRPEARRVAETWEGDDVDPTVLRRLACNADLYAILIDKLGLPTAVGRTRRSATREQRLQLRTLYDKCPLDGVTPFARCELHHVNVFFEDGGDTEIENLVPLSSKWYHLIHDQNWMLKMGRDRELRVWRPDGTLHRINSHQRNPPPDRLNSCSRALL